MLIAVWCLAVGVWNVPGVVRGAPPEPGRVVHRAVGAEEGWRDGGGDMRYRLERNEWSSTETRSGKPSRYVRLVAGNGSKVYLIRPVAAARVIDELEADVWVKSDRPGIQILARVVLPRSRDGLGGEALTTLVRGSSYQRVGTWQSLVLDQMPQRLAEAARRLRAAGHRNVDVREAYVDQLILNIYGGPGVTNVWIDEPVLRGAVSPARSSVGWQAAGARPSTAVRGSAATVVATSAPSKNTARSEALGTPTVEAARVTLQGSVLTVNGRPLLPRVIDYRGEALEELAALGFNAVRFETVPTSTQLAAAERAGLWVICPPPIARDGRDAEAAVSQIPATYRQVLAWDLGRDLADAELPAIRQWARRVRNADGLLSRPLIVQAEAQLRAYSRHADLLLLDRRPLGSGLSLELYGRWLGERSRLARPGTPFWATIQNEPPPTVVQQAGRLGSGAPMVEADQILLLAQTAISAGVRGLYFPSSRRLDGQDAVAKHRRLALEWVNLQLAIVEPWAAAGRRIAEIESREEAIHGAVLKTGRSRLVLPMWLDDKTQFVAGGDVANSVSLVVPGAPEAHRAFELAPDGLHLLRSTRRVTGGVRLTLDEMDLSTMVVLSQDPLAYSQLIERLHGGRRRATALRRQLAEGYLRRVEHVVKQLAAGPTAAHVSQTTHLIDRARTELQAADGRLNVGDLRQAGSHIGRAQRLLRHVARYHWEQAVAQLGTPVANPLAVCFETLPTFWKTLPQWYGRTDGQNRLRGGGFERLDEMDWAGWQHYRYEQPGVESHAELSPLAPHSGRFSLHLKAKNTTDTPLSVVPSSPVWVVSGDVPVQTGSWVRIDGWVRVPEPIRGSVDRLLILDSLGGPALAHRVDRTVGWQPFTLYRFADRSASVRLTIALTGLGEAWIDDLRVTVLPSTAQPAAQVPIQARSHMSGLRRLPPVWR